MRTDTFFGLTAGLLLTASTLVSAQSEDSAGARPIFTCDNGAMSVGLGTTTTIHDPGIVNYFESLGVPTNSAGEIAFHGYHHPISRVDSFESFVSHPGFQTAGIDVGGTTRIVDAYSFKESGGVKVQFVVRKLEESILNCFKGGHSAGEGSTCVRIIQGDNERGISRREEYYQGHVTVKKSLPQYELGNWFFRDCVNNQ